MLKILTVLGVRPQFIKAAAVSRIISNDDFFQEVIVHTGQHFDASMSEIFFKDMGIPGPKYNLSINQMSHGAMTGRMLEKIEQIVLDEKPDWLLVYGDTNSTLAGALAAVKHKIKIAHVEAGLRSFNMAMPEEINRILTDRISNVLFCPTDQAVQNLKEEGFSAFDVDILNVGDVMYDAANFYAQRSHEKSSITPPKEDFVLVTIHRAENTDDPSRLINILEALNEISTKLNIVLPLHPRTRKIIASLGVELKFNTIDPVGYFEIIELLKHCRLVLTDSGGLQKEAYFFNKYCITMRDETEWVELVQTGANVLVGADKLRIVKAFDELLDKKVAFVTGLYGDSHAAEKIVNYLKSSH